MTANGIGAIAACCAVLVCAAAGPVRADGDVNFILGGKQLDDGDWGDLDQQTEFGALISVGAESWPVRIAIDVIGTTDEITVFDPFFQVGLSTRANTFELDLGVRKIWEHQNMRPFLGGGIAVVSGEIEAIAGSVTVSSDATGGGLWIDGGAYWRLGRRFNLGFEARISRAKIEPELLGERFEVEAGGEHLGLILGWGW